MLSIYICLSINKVMTEFKCIITGLVGDIVGRYLIYLFGRHKSELMIISEANDLHQLSQISDKLPDSIDTVIAYNGYVYLFQNNTQYKLYMKDPVIIRQLFD